MAKQDSWRPHAVGCTLTHEEYQALAVVLARDALRLGAIRNRLARNRATQPLFDTDRFRRHVEAAYRQIWQLHSNGDNPRTFHVAGVESAFGRTRRRVNE